MNTGLRRAIAAALIVSTAAFSLPARAETIGAGAVSARQQIGAFIERAEVRAQLASGIATLPAGGCGPECAKTAFVFAIYGLGFALWLVATVVKRIGGELAKAVRKPSAEASGERN